MAADDWGKIDPGPKYSKAARLHQWHTVKLVTTTSPWQPFKIICCDCNKFVKFPHAQELTIFQYIDTIQLRELIRVTEYCHRNYITIDRE